MSKELLIGERHVTDYFQILTTCVLFASSEHNINSNQKNSKWD